MAVCQNVLLSMGVDNKCNYCNYIALPLQLEITCCSQSWREQEKKNNHEYTVLSR